MIHASGEGNIGIVKAQGGFEIEGNINSITKEKIVNNTNQIGYEGNRILTISFTSQVFSSNNTDLAFKLFDITNLKSIITPNNILVSVNMKKL